MPSIDVVGTFGSTRFILTYSSGGIVINNRAHSRIIFDDYEPVMEETIFLDGSRDIDAKGQYLNPKIIMKKTDYSEWKYKLKPLMNKVVNFTPFADNSSWNFNCKVVSVTPFFENGLFWKNYVEINLKSIGFVDITAMDDGSIPPI